MILMPKIGDEGMPRYNICIHYPANADTELNKHMYEISESTRAGYRIHIPYNWGTLEACTASAKRIREFINWILSKERGPNESRTSISSFNQPSWSDCLNGKFGVYAITDELTELYMPYFPYHMVFSTVAVSIIEEGTDREDFFEIDNSPWS